MDDSATLPLIQQLVFDPARSGATLGSRSHLSDGWGHGLSERAVAALILLVTLPLWIAVAMLIKCTSRGPILFVQQRVGQYGRPYNMLKFRTMRIGAERETGPVWAKPGDPRCTWIGRWLRRFSIDELPQLVNVIRGEMNLVGPRPERPYFVREFSMGLPEYPQRHVVKPGISGWAQIHGWRGDSSLKERLRFDLYYVAHRSWKLDAYILLMTPWAAFRARNAC